MFTFIYSFVIHCLSYICPCMCSHVVHSNVYSIECATVNENSYMPPPIIQNDESYQTRQFDKNKKNQSNTDEMMMSHHIQFVENDIQQCIIDVSKVNIDTKQEKINVIEHRYTLNKEEALCEFCGIYIPITQFCCNNCAQTRFAKYRNTTGNNYYKYKKI